MDKPRHPKWVFGAFAALLAAGSLYFFSVTVEKYGHTTIRVSNDGRYQYALAVSLYEDGDLDMTNQYAPAQLGNPHKYGPTETGYPANPLSIGPALLWAPAYFVARLVIGDDGLDDLHQQITFYTSFLCAFGALLLVYAVARRRFGPGASFAGAAVAVLSGPVLQYAIHQPSYSHAPSALFVALLLWEWDRGRPGRTPASWLRCGAFLGAAMLMRAQNVVFALPLVAEGVGRIIGGFREGRGLRAALAPAGAAVVAALVFTPQIVTWQVIYGFGFGLPQGGGFMRWGSSMLIDTLFSSMNGLFLYAPGWIAGIAGLVVLARRDRSAAGWLAATFLVAAYVNGAVNDWWSLGGIANRRYDGCLVHVGLGIAALASAIAARPRLAAGLLVGTAVGACVMLNFGMWDLYTRFHRDKELDQTRSVGVYLRALEHLDRNYVGRLGNPLAWPAAIPFSLLTGGQVAQYEEVVGHHLIEGRIETGDYKQNKRFEQAILRFGYPDDQRFLVAGFGSANEMHWRYVARRARFLAPINTTFPVRCRLEGAAVAEIELEVLWNGERIAGGRFAPGAHIDLQFTVPANKVTRGVNEVTLFHPNLERGVVGAVYGRFEMLAGEE